MASSGPGGEREAPVTTCCPSPLGRPAHLGLPTLPLPPLFSLRRPLRQSPGLPGSSGDSDSVAGKRKEEPLTGLKTLPGLRLALPGGAGVSLLLGREPPLFAWLALLMIARLLSA